MADQPATSKNIQDLGKSINTQLSSLAKVLKGSNAQETKDRKTFLIAIESIFKKTATDTKTVGKSINTQFSGISKILKESNAQLLSLSKILKESTSPETKDTGVVKLLKGNKAKKLKIQENKVDLIKGSLVP